MVDSENIEGMTEEEMYQYLLKEFEEFKDEGRDVYLEDLLKKIRRELEDEKEE